MKTVLKLTLFLILIQPIINCDSGFAPRYKINGLRILGIKVEPIGENQKELYVYSLVYNEDESSPIYYIWIPYITLTKGPQLCKAIEQASPQEIIITDIPSVKLEVDKDSLTLTQLYLIVCKSNEYPFVTKEECNEITPVNCNGLFDVGFVESLEMGPSPEIIGIYINEENWNEGDEIKFNLCRKKEDCTPAIIKIEIKPPKEHIIISWYINKGDLSNDRSTGTSPEVKFYPIESTNNGTFIGVIRNEESSGINWFVRKYKVVNE